LINEILDISRIEAGAMQLSLEPVNLDDVLHEALDIMRPLAAERAIEFTAPVRTDRPVYVFSRPSAFQTGFAQLILERGKVQSRKGQGFNLLSIFRRGRDADGG
jgi:Osmosensitive K+ channel histidine kinase